MILNTIRLIPFLALLVAPATFAGEETERMKQRWQEVSGSAIHYFDEMPGRNVITHAVTPTETGLELRTTETIDLFGDLNGRVLYQPESVIDNVAGTITNTGNQVFSGTILGEGPVLLHDDYFRFDVTLGPTVETVGQVFLVNRIDGPVVHCIIRIVGTGFTPEGNGLADYSGRCRFRGNGGRGARFDDED